MVLNECHAEAVEGKKSTPSMRRNHKTGTPKLGNRAPRNQICQPKTGKPKLRHQNWQPKTGKPSLATPKLRNKTDNRNLKTHNPDHQFQPAWSLNIDKRRKVILGLEAKEEGCCDIFFSNIL